MHRDILYALQAIFVLCFFDRTEYYTLYDSSLKMVIGEFSRKDEIWLVNSLVFYALGRGQLKYEIIVSFVVIAFLKPDFHVEQT